MKTINLENQRFGRLIVLEQAVSYRESNGAKRIKWLCKCDCGNLKEISRYNLRSGYTKSCGCLKKEGNDFKHGYSKNEYFLYKVWCSIIQRCNKKNITQFKGWIGRGIIVCDEWKSNPKYFVEWALKNGYKKGLQIDRIDNDGNYEPSNCRFVDRSLNCINSRKRINNTSGYTGVMFNKSNAKWQSYITYQKKSYFVGNFKTINEAVRRRNIFILLNKLPHKIQQILLVQKGDRI